MATPLWKCIDGKIFDKEIDAKNHENFLKKKKNVTDLCEGYRIDHAMEIETIVDSHSLSEFLSNIKNREGMISLCTKISECYGS